MPRIQVLHFLKIKLIVSCFIEEHQAGIRCCIFKDLLISKMHNLGKMFSICNDTSQWLTILSIEKLMRQNKTQSSLFIKKTQSFFNKDNINIIIAFAGGFIFLLVKLNINIGCLL